MTRRLELKLARLAIVDWDHHSLGIIRIYWKVSPIDYRDCACTHVHVQIHSPLPYQRIEVRIQHPVDITVHKTQKTWIQWLPHTVHSTHVHTHSPFCLSRVHQWTWCTYLWASYEWGIFQRTGCSPEGKLPPSLGERDSRQPCHHRYTTAVLMSKPRLLSHKRIHWQAGCSCFTAREQPLPLLESKWSVHKELLPRLLAHYCSQWLLCMLKVPLEMVSWWSSLFEVCLLTCELSYRSLW